MNSARLLLLACIALCGAVLAAPSGAAEDHDIGAAVFHGEAAAGVAILTGGVEAPASRFACATCHGRDGLGGQEGAYRAPPILWRLLASETDSRPGYDAAAFARLIRTGTDPGGRQISALMPQYRLSDDEASGLADYLRRLESEARAGVEDRSVRFTIDYDASQLAIARKIQSSLNQALVRLGEPSIFGRSLRFELRALDAPGAALASLMSPIADRHYLDASTKTRLPVIAPLHALSGAEDPRDARGLFASQTEQLKWLSDQAPAEAPVVAEPGNHDALFAGRKRIAPAVWAAAPTPAAIFPDGLDAAPAPTGIMRQPVTIYTTVDGSGRTLQQWLDAGASLRLADPRAAGGAGQRRADLDRLADATVRAVVLALERAGRDVTRARFMAAFDEIAFTLPDWPAIDFSAQRLTGASTIGLIELKARTLNE